MSWSMTNNLMLGASPRRALPVTQAFKRRRFRVHMNPRALRGSAGLVWEAMGLWLVVRLSETRLCRSFLEEKRLVQPKPCSSGARELLQAVLAVDVLGYLGRAIQALEMLPRGFLSRDGVLQGLLSAQHLLH